MHQADSQQPVAIWFCADLLVGRDLWREQEYSSQWIRFFFYQSIPLATAHDARLLLFSSGGSSSQSIA